ncbi:hypothetical protein AVEN_175097-1 [Araneus ventricosus]|uniref:Reverse transcriptase Ty1/copia-type domain-containing protein n=1 Tax=Araneus ventricosus TaxID=182803 RepID=A0A4Y2PNW8_ARAVE|nr:hypothetical protein AVEN_175097-1 [Araneus ventricosus]
MDREINVMIERKVWDLVDPPENAKVLGNRWVYTLKRDENNRAVRFKTRLVAQEGMGLYKVNYLTAKIFMLQQSIINSVYLFLDDVASLEKHLTAGNHNFTKISSTLDKVRFSYTEKVKASTGRSPIAANEPKNLANNTAILNVFRRVWALPNRKITRFSYK